MPKLCLVRETALHPTRGTPTLAERVATVRAFVDAQRVRKDYKPGWFEEVETELHKQMVEIERDLTAELIAAHDVDAPMIEIAGKVHRRVLRTAQTYMTAAGPVTAERWLYRDRDDDSEPSVSPVERRLGIIDFWTPKAAKQALWVVAQMTPQKAAETFAQIGSMTPSKSSLDRLPKKLSEVWEASREEHEVALREALIVPEGAVSVAVSIDGVLAPIEGGNRPTDVRDTAAREGRISKGPAGYREVGCATLTFCDAEGDMLGAIRMARAPEPNKRTLKASLAAELCAALRQAPELKVVKLADGVDDNWSFLTGELPDGAEALDFFHASEHLHAAIAAAYGDGTLKTRHRYEELRETLRDESGGVARVLRALDHLRKQHPRAEPIRRCAAYFRKHRHRMDYAGLKAAGLPIGSGLVEAACKTLVAQRLKLSGMRWGLGAQAILTARGWDQSDRFNEAWALLAAHYHAEVFILAKVIPFSPPKPPRRTRGAG
jgi:hypothetical protein